MNSDLTERPPILDQLDETVGTRDSRRSSTQLDYLWEDGRRNDLSNSAYALQEPTDSPLTTRFFAVRVHSREMVRQDQAVKWRQVTSRGA